MIRSPGEVTFHRAPLFSLSTVAFSSCFMDEDIIIILEFSSASHSVPLPPSALHSFLSSCFYSVRSFSFISLVVPSCLRMRHLCRKEFSLVLRQVWLLSLVLGRWSLNPWTALPGKSVFVFWGLWLHRIVWQVVPGDRCGSRGISLATELSVSAALIPAPRVLAY